MCSSVLCVTFAVNRKLKVEPRLGPGDFVGPPSHFEFLWNLPMPGLAGCFP